MTFDDIFKSSFLENVSSRKRYRYAIDHLCCPLGIGGFIFLSYKKTYRGVMYSSGSAPH